MMAFTVAAGALLLGAVLALALGQNWLRGAVSLVTQAVACFLVLFQVVPIVAGGPDLQGVVTWSFPIETIAVRVDGLSAFFLSWSLPMTLLGTIYATGYLKPYYATRNAGVQFALLNMVAFSFLVIYALENVFVFLLGWEIAAVAAWLLVIWDDHNQKVRFAGFNYLVSTHVGLFFLVAAFMVMRSQTGAMDFASFSPFLQRSTPLRDVTFVLLVVAFGLKSAFFPFHTWLPRAHAAAPAHVSALMSGVIHKAGLFGLLRFILLMHRPDEWMGWFVMGCSALSAVMGVLYTTNQRDVKRLLGYSSTENVGIAGMGFGLGCLGLSWNQPALVALGFAGGMLHVFNHALFKCLLFYAAGAVYRSTHTVDLERLGGLLRKMPWTGALFLVGGLAIGALPPFNGFVSEFLLYAGLLGPDAPAGTPRLMLVGVAGLLAFVGAVGALAITRAFGVVFLGTPRDPSIHASGEVGLAMLLPMVVHAVGVVVVGVFPATGLWLVARPTALFVGVASAHAQLAGAQTQLTPVAGVATMVVLLVVGLVGLRWLLAGGLPAPQHVTWGCGYTAPTPRMQYTGMSFSARFGGLFEAALPQLQRTHLPKGPFPQGQGAFSTHAVDAVERRIFEVLGQGEQAIADNAARVSSQPRFSFAAGLVVLIIMVMVVVDWGPSP